MNTAALNEHFQRTLKLTHRKRSSSSLTSAKNKCFPPAAGHKLAWKTHRWRQLHEFPQGDKQVSQHPHRSVIFFDSVMMPPPPQLSSFESFRGKLSRRRKLHELFSTVSACRYRIHLMVYVTPPPLGKIFKPLQEGVNFDMVSTRVMRQKMRRGNQFPTFPVFRNQM